MKVSTAYVVFSTTDENPRTAYLHYSQGIAKCEVSLMEANLLDRETAQETADLDPSWDYCELSFALRNHSWI